MTTLLAGGATADITPDTGVPMGGYSARQGTATGVHDQLLARTIMFSDGSADLVISVCDLVGVGDEIVRRARQLAQSELGIPAGSVLIAATHTHSGPLDVNAAELTPYAEQVAQGILASIREAAGSRQPVTLKAGTVEVTTISQNRRDPDGPIETVATIVVATPAGGGRPVATLVNYACHSTVLEHDNMEFSPDFPGAMARFLEREIGGTAVYLQGAAGNINPVWMRHDFTEVERVGGILGSAATRVVHELQPLGAGQWCINLSWSEDVEKPAAGTLLTAAPLAATQVTVDLQRRPGRTQADLEQEISQVEAERSAAAGDQDRHHELTARRNQLRVEWAVAGGGRASAAGGGGAHRDPGHADQRRVRAGEPAGRVLRRDRERDPGGGRTAARADRRVCQRHDRLRPHQGGVRAGRVRGGPGGLRARCRAGHHRGGGRCRALALRPVKRAAPGAGR